MGRFWKWSIGVIAALFTAGVLLGLVAIASLFLADAGFFRRWGLWILPAGLVLGVVGALIALVFVARATSAPALVRRSSLCMAGLGLTSIVSGVVLVSLPSRAPAHPGRAPAGDIAAGGVAMAVGLGGAALLAIAVVLGVVGIGWGLARRRRGAPPGAGRGGPPGPGSGARARRSVPRQAARRPSPCLRPRRAAARRAGPAIG